MYVLEFLQYLCSNVYSIVFGKLEQHVIGLQVCGYMCMYAGIDHVCMCSNVYSIVFGNLEQHVIGLQVCDSVCKVLMCMVTQV